MGSAERLAAEVQAVFELSRRHNTDLVDDILDCYAAMCVQGLRNEEVSEKSLARYRRHRHELFRRLSVWADLPCDKRDEVEDVISYTTKGRVPPCSRPGANTIGRKETKMEPCCPMCGSNTDAFDENFWECGSPKENFAPTIACLALAIQKLEVEVLGAIAWREATTLRLEALERR